jgi:NitT/TauT family transport system substrate-binding protein
VVSAPARPTVLRLAAVTLVLVSPLAAVACTDEGGDPATAETFPAGPAPGEPSGLDDGCGDRAVTDPADLSADREVARCAPGAPEADPLPATTPLRVAVPPQPGEELAPVLLADRLGEFEAENLDVEIVERDAGEAMVDLDAGRVDVVVGPLNGPFFDSVRRGSGARAVLGGVLSRAPNDLATAQAGLWLRRSALQDHDDLADLQDQPVGVPGGVGGAALYPVSNTLEQSAANTETVRVIDLSGAEAADQLRAGHLAAAWLDGSSWLPLVGDDAVELVATLPASESIDGTVFSDRLTGADRAVGLAYARAVIRTINTHLAGDSQDDDEVVAELAAATGLDEDAITDTGPLLYDWELREGTLSRIEDALITTGGVGYDAAQPTDDFLDRSLATDAVGG